MATITDKTLAKYGSEELFHDVHRDMLKRFFLWVKDNNIPICLMFGGFLGYCRENRIILWDHDIDVGILQDDFHLLTDEVLSKLPEYGFDKPDFSNKKYHYVEDNFNGEYFRIYNSNLKTKYELIEIFPLKNYENTDNIFYKFWFQYKQGKKKIYQDLMWVDFYDFKIQIPQDLEAALMHQYGEKWHMPKKSKQYLKNIDSEYQSLIVNRLKELKIGPYEHYEKINNFFKF